MHSPAGAEVAQQPEGADQAHGIGDASDNEVVHLVGKIATHCIQQVTLLLCAAGQEESHGNTGNGRVGDSGLLSRDDPALSFVSLMRICYALLRCGSIDTRGLAAEKLLRPQMLRRVVKRVLGTRRASVGAAGGSRRFTVHFLTGHLGAKFMSVLAVALRNANEGPAPTEAVYQDTRASCRLTIRVATVFLTTCIHFLNAGPGDVVTMLPGAKQTVAQFETLAAMSMLAVRNAVRRFLVNLPPRERNPRRARWQNCQTLDRLLPDGYCSIVVDLLSHAAQPLPTEDLSGGGTMLAAMAAAGASPLRMLSEGTWWARRDPRETARWQIRTAGRDIVSELVNVLPRRQMEIMEKIAVAINGKTVQCTLCGGRGRGLHLVDHHRRQHEEEEQRVRRTASSTPTRRSGAALAASPGGTISTEKLRRKEKRKINKSTNTKGDDDSDDSDDSDEAPEFCALCHGVGTLSVGLPTTTVQNLLKSIWRQCFQRTVETVLHRADVLGGIPRSKIELLSKKPSEAEAAAMSAASGDSDPKAAVDGTGVFDYVRGRIVAHGWATMHQLKDADSAGPSGSPRGSAGIPLPPNHVLVVLTEDRFLILNQPSGGSDQPGSGVSSSKAANGGAPDNGISPGWLCPADVARLQKPLLTVMYDNVERLCVSYDGHTLHMQSEDAINAESAEAVLVTRNFFFRHKHEGTVLYHELMQRLRLRKHSQLVESGGARTMDTSGGGISAKPILEVDLSNELGLRRRIGQYHNSTDFRIVLISPIDFYGNSLGQANESSSDVYTPEVVYQGLRHLVLTDHGVLCILKQENAMWVEALVSVCSRLYYRYLHRCCYDTFCHARPWALCAFCSPLTRPTLFTLPHPPAAVVRLSFYSFIAKYDGQLFDRFNTVTYNRLKKHLLASVAATSDGADDSESKDNAIKRELEDAMLKLKRRYREELDESSRAVARRQRQLYPGGQEGAGKEMQSYRLEHLMECCFSTPHDAAGLPKMSLGFTEVVPPPKGQPDRRKKIVRHTDRNGGDGVYVRSMSQDMMHFVFLDEETCLTWQHALQPYVEQSGLAPLRVDDLRIEKEGVF